MNNNTITKFKYFTISDYEKEEKYLREMSNKGYHLINISFPGFYKFQIGEPEDIVYRLDYNNYKREDKNSYIKLFEDYGWKYLWEFAGWSYFKKEGEEANLEIFSDDESRLELVKKVFSTRLLPLIIIFVAVFVQDIQNILSGQYFIENKGFSIFFIGLFILYVVLISHTGYGLYKLNNKYMKNKD